MLSDRAYRSVFILHGYAGSSAIHWQTWLARKCRGLGLRTVYPKLPKIYAPERVAWVRGAARAIGKFDRDTAVVCHSLGCSTILHVLGEDSRRRIGLLVLVAPPSSSKLAKSDLSFLCGFLEGVDARKVRGQVGKVVVFSSDNDPYVSASEARALARELGGSFRLIRKGGHLSPSAGFHTFPDVLRLICGEEKEK